MVTAALNESSGLSLSWLVYALVISTALIFVLAGFAGATSGGTHWVFGLSCIAVFVVSTGVIASYDSIAVGWQVFLTLLQSAIAFVGIGVGPRVRRKLRPSEV